MKWKIFISLALIITGTVPVLESCKKGEGSKKPAGGYQPTYLKITIPEGWPQPPADTFKDNPLTEKGFQLGRKLFYDGRLSKDGNFPCASCHQQFAAFSTYDHQFSHGVDNTFSSRNAPAVFNLAWMKEMHWDGGINNIEVQPLAPITNSNEMAETIGHVLHKINADSAYHRMFASAFGDTIINSQRMLKALAQFTGSIQSYNSKYDKVKRNEAGFTLAEQNGYNTFKAKCDACHKEPLFTDHSFRNNGLTLDPFLKDYGRMRITGEPKDSLKFKVPSLRNVMISMPYMHDGRRFSILSAIEHYRTGIAVNQPTLDTLLKNRIVMTNQQKVDLAMFLGTLTDSVMLHDNRFAQPN